MAKFLNNLNIRDKTDSVFLGLRKKPLLVVGIEQITFHNQSHFSEFKKC